MKKFLLAIAAVLSFTATTEAADLAVKPMYTKAVMSPVSAYNWSGFYVGAHIGGGWSDKDWCRNGVGNNGCALPIPGQNFASVDPSGWLGGIQGGYNWQFNRFVVGIEGDLSIAGLKGSALLRTTRFAHTDIDWMGTLAARVGYAFDRTLVYGKVGVGFVGEDHWIVNTVGVVGTTTSSTRAGWLVGLGVEHALYNNWSVKLEYNYMDFGSKTLAIANTNGGGATPLVTIDQNVHVVKLGVNYHFNSPIIAKY